MAEEINGTPESTGHPYLLTPHFSVHEVAYQEVLARHGIADRGSCFFGSLAMLASACSRYSPEETLDRLIEVFKKYDPEYLAKANEVLPESQRVQDLHHLPPLVDLRVGSVNTRWFDTTHIGNTLRLLNTMFAREELGIALSIWNVQQIVSESGEQSRASRQSIVSRVGAAIMENCEQYARQETGILLPVRELGVEDKRHITAICGVLKTPSGDSLIIDDPSLEETEYLSYRTVGRLFTKGLDTVVVDYAQPAMLVAKAAATTIPAI